MSDSTFEAYWRERQLRTHRYTDRECPDDWGLAFKADAESAWRASRLATLEEAAKACEKIADGFDFVSNTQAEHAADECALAIRALAPGMEGEGK